MATDATLEKQLGGLSRSGKVPKQAKVKNKAAADLQITAEQLLREAKERELEIVPPPPKQKVRKNNITEISMQQLFLLPF